MMNLQGIGRPRAVGRQATQFQRDLRPKGAFTLVELLVVVGIIMAVAVVALPAVTSLSKGSSRRSAVSLTMAGLDQARGLALAHGSTSYFVVADTNPTWPERYRCRAFAVFEEAYDAKSESYRRQIITPWKLLPEGIVFKPDADTLFGAAREKFYAHPAGRELELPFIRFNSTGGVDQPLETQLAKLKLLEGFLDASDAPVATNPARGAAEETLKISPYTGRARREAETNG